MTTYTLEEAEQWFLSNASGELRCVKDGEERTVNSYPQAKAFFTESESSESDDDSIGIGLGFMAGAASGMFSDPSSDIASTPEPDTSSSFDSGGGDFGGAGSSGDY